MFAADNYEILVPPLSKSFTRFTVKEAQRFFDWFMSVKPTRMNYLVSCCTKDLHISDGQIDYSPNSLVLIWRWFLRVAAIVPSTQSDLGSIKMGLGRKNRDFTDYLASNSDGKFSLTTEYIIRDIGMYLGEVFVKNNDGIRWSYHTDKKQDSFANIPALFGFFDANFSPPFMMIFEPIHMVRVQASNIFDNTQKENDLLKVYSKWIERIV